jgi:hypothetical protein
LDRAAALDVVPDEAVAHACLRAGTQNIEAFRKYQEGWRIYNVVHAGP